MSKLHSKLEQKVNENLVVRQIAKEISMFGISQSQRLMLIYFIALELENNDHARGIVDLIKSLDENLFVLDDVEDLESQTTKDGDNANG